METESVSKRAKRVLSQKPIEETLQLGKVSEGSKARTSQSPLGWCILGLRYPLPDHVQRRGRGRGRTKTERPNVNGK